MGRVSWATVGVRELLLPQMQISTRRPASCRADSGRCPGLEQSRACSMGTVSRARPFSMTLAIADLLELTRRDLIGAAILHEPLRGFTPVGEHGLSLTGG